MHHTAYEKHHTIFRMSKFLILVRARALIRFVLSMYLLSLFPRLASAASAGASAPCDCRARFRAAFRWFLFWAPAAQIASGFDRFRGCSAPTASTVSRPSMLGRRLGARRRAARMNEASEEQEREKRREGKEGASPSSPSWMARRDGPWRV